MNVELATMILGMDISEAKDDAKVKKAYREVAAALHPDKHQDSPERFNRLFTVVNQAYEFLKDYNVHTVGDPLPKEPAYGPIYRPQQTAYGTMSGYGEHRKPEDKIKIKFADLQTLYDGLWGMATLRTEKGNTVMVDLAHLNDYTVVVEDTIELIVGKDGQQVQKFGILQTRKGTKDQYSVSLNIEVDTDVKFPLDLRVQKPKAMNIQVTTPGRWKAVMRFGGAVLNIEINISMASK